MAGIKERIIKEVEKLPEDKIAEVSLLFSQKKQTSLY